MPSPSTPDSIPGITTAATEGRPLTVLNGSASRTRSAPLRGSLARRAHARPAAVVAGGAGFLGSHLCDRLIADGFRVYCLDSLYTGLDRNIDHLANEPRFIFVEQDVRNRLPAFSDARYIYNLACPASPPHYQKDPVHTITTNVIGTLNLLELAVAQNARLLFTSTSEVYGDPEVHPQPEDYRGSVNPVGPRACYDEGKRVAEALCFDFLRSRRADIRVCRVFNTYGPRMRPDDGRIVSNLVTQALAGEPMTIYGSGQQTRSFCYVSDLIEGFVRLMNLSDTPAGPINLGNPGEFTISELAELITSITGSNVPVVYGPLPVDDPRRRRPNIDLAERLLSWRPRISLREGLGPTIEWFSGLMDGSGLAGKFATERASTTPQPAATSPAPANRIQR